MNAFLICALAFAQPAVGQGPAIFRVTDVEVVAGEYFDVSIQGDQLAGLGAFQFTLSCDPPYATFDEAKLAPVVNGLIESHRNSQGSLRIKVVLGEPLSQDGALVIARGKLVDDATTRSIDSDLHGWFEVEELRAWTYEPIMEIAAEGQRGQISIRTSSPGIPSWLYAAIGGAVLIFVLALLAIRRSSKLR
ncbi:MAG TPA: hypothetical protein PKD54_12430 [Pirellulaceae bacterium]|nr:hypothetical protein [Pirellulaceae bacterium]